MIRSIQFLIDMYYRFPKAKRKLWKRFGGYSKYKEMLKNKKLMELNAVNLSVVNSYPDGLPIYFLTGKNYLFQTLYCIQSLTKVSNEKFNFILVDDGSFDDQIRTTIKRQIPKAIIFEASFINERLAELLPEDKFPNLNHKRLVYPHIKKLTDIHILPGDGWKIVLDSDMLFEAEPSDIIDWLRKPTVAVCMKDCENSYGYSRELMKDLCDQEIPELINVGVIGLNSQDIDWVAIDSWIAVLEEKEGTSYYLEQAITAMIIGEAPLQVLPASSYIVNPSAARGNETAILHHYVDLSKNYYFNKAWKSI